MIRSVVFDVGETLVDDTREWRAWAQWLGVRPHTMSALVGAVTCQGLDNAEALRLIRPDIDVAAERQAREIAGCGELLEEHDLYPDVRPALSTLREHGWWVGAAGNQTQRAATLLRELDLPVDGLVTSGEWGVAKPDSRFFAELVAWAPGRPDEIVYVGDHRDHDIFPAKSSGLRAALVLRGPWGYLWADDPTLTGAADWRVNQLTELPELVAAA